MNCKVTNLTNSPYDLKSDEGTVTLPAFGYVKGNFSGDYLELLKVISAVEVEEIQPEKPIATKHKGK